MVSCVVPERRADGAAERAPGRPQGRSGGRRSAAWRWAPWPCASGASTSERDAGGEPDGQSMLYHVVS